MGEQAGEQEEGLLMPAIAIRWVGDPRTVRHSTPVPNPSLMAAQGSPTRVSPERATRRPPDPRPAVYRGAKLGNLLRMERKR
jgi:hypothetical protein